MARRVGVHGEQQERQRIGDQVDLQQDWRPTEDPDVEPREPPQQRNARRPHQGREEAKEDAAGLRQDGQDEGVANAAPRLRQREEVPEVGDVEGQGVVERPQPEPVQLSRTENRVQQAGDQQQAQGTQPDVDIEPGVAVHHRAPSLRWWGAVQRRRPERGAHLSSKAKGANHTIRALS